MTYDRARGGIGQRLLGAQHCQRDRRREMQCKRLQRSRSLDQGITARIAAHLGGAKSVTWTATAPYRQSDSRRRKDD